MVGKVPPKKHHTSGTRILQKSWQETKLRVLLTKHALTRGFPPSLLHRRAPDRWSGEAVGEADVHDALQQRNHSTDKIWEGE